METNEIMTNEEVIETTEEIVKTGTGKWFKVAAGIGVAVLVGGLAYKYVAKPIVAKIKSKKEQQMIESEEVTYFADDDESEEN